MSTNTATARCNSDHGAASAAVLVDPGTEAPRRMPLKTREEVQTWFQSQGISIADWAMEHGFSAALTREVIKGRRCIRGQSHHIAVALGMKAPSNISDPIQP